MVFCVHAATTQSANDVKNFIVLSESPSKVRKNNVYHFLIFLLVPEIKSTKILSDFSYQVQFSTSQSFMSIEKSWQFFNIFVIMDDMSQLIVAYDEIRNTSIGK